MKTEINTLTTEFFTNLWVVIDSLEVEEQENNIFLVKIKTEESGIIIWPHWKNLEAIQGILKLMSSRKIWERIKLHLEVNDYMKSKDDRLLGFIKSKISQVNSTWKDVCLPFFSAYERKKIHSYISELNDDSISTKSLGEGKERRLYICKQAEKLTIDIDWDDI